jgi:septum site-determining protein MinD
MGVTLGIIAVKGGVGKTTIATSLAVDLARRFQKKVLLVDANYSAPNVGLHMDIVTPNKTIHDVLAGKARLQHAVHTKHGIDVMPGSYSYRREIRPLLLRDKLAVAKKKYDFIVIDSSPNLNDEVLSVMLASDALFVVSTPDYPTLSCSLSAAWLARQRGKPIAGIILNKLRNPRYELSLEDIEHAMGIPVVARIPDDEFHGRALYLRMPSIVYRNNTVFAQEIAALGATLTHHAEPIPFFHRLFPRFLRREVVNRQLVKERLYTSTLPTFFERKQLSTEPEFVIEEVMQKHA